MYFVVFGTDKPGKLALREETRPAHRAHARNPEGHAVKLILGEPPAEGVRAVLFIDTVGRPMSPTSVAGVHRRHRRRRARVIR